MKKLYLNFKIFIYSLFSGLRKADKIIVSNDENNNAIDIGGIEQQQEVNNVYKDLLKGEVTEAVRELRHEMYYAERKSKKYLYNGGGRAKVNSTFGQFKGNVENEDNLDILIVQNNSVIPSSLQDEGVSVYGNKFDIDDNISDNLRNKTRIEKEYRIKIIRDFIPRFCLESFVKKVVVKSLNNNKVMLDLYVSKYVNKFETTSKLFHNEMEKIYQGFTSDIIKFNMLCFVAKDAYGADDLTFHSFKDIEYDNIVEYDGNYVLKFIATMNETEDLIQEFYHDKTAKKCENHELRENSTIDFTVAKSKMEQSNIDTSEAENLINNL